MTQVEWGGVANGVEMIIVVDVWSKESKEPAIPTFFRCCRTRLLVRDLPRRSENPKEWYRDRNQFGKR